MDIYDAIYYRKSSNKYLQKPLKVDLLEEIKKVCLEVNGYDDKISAHVIEKGHLVDLLVGKNIRVKAPHYILISSKRDNSFMDVGFASEELVLKLTILGVSSCYLDINLKYEDVFDMVNTYEKQAIDDEIIEENYIKPQILIGIGYSDGEDIFRDSYDQIDRKKTKNICKNINSNYQDILELVQLAPSYKNTQPWSIYNELNRFDIYYDKKYLKDEKLMFISMGCFMKHFDLAIKKKEKKVNYTKNIAKNKLGKRYLLTALVNG